MEKTAKQIDREFYTYASRAENNVAFELQMSGKKDVERQYPIGKYFADFYFPEYNLVLEIDGAEFHSGEEHKNHDDIRDKFMNDLGYTVVRITGRLAINNPSGVLNILRLFPKGRTFYLTSNNDIAYVQQISLAQQNLADSLKVVNETKVNEF